MSVNGAANDRPWLPARFAAEGGTLDITMAKAPQKKWGSAPADAPPSFGPDTP
jgi:putative alpha-1,2-mannosidase